MRSSNDFPIMIIRSVLLAIFAFSSIWAHSQLSFDQEKLDSLLNYLFDNGRASLALAVHQDGNTVYEHAAGLKDFQDGKPIMANADSRFRIGSITKTFTAALIMQAVEEGKISLDAKLSQYYPDVINADKITIEIMLHHRSGINNFTDNPEFLMKVADAKDKSEIKEMIATLPADFEPDAKFSYCNTGYILLGYILEDIYKEDYFSLVQNKLTKPLGLKSFGIMDQVDVSKNIVKSFLPMPEGWSPIEHFTNPLVVGAAGAITSSASELAAFWYALLNAKLLKQSSLDKMQTFVDNYGFALYPIPFNGEMGVAHNGGVDGFNSNASYWKSEDFSVVLFVNGLNMAYNDILIGVLSIIKGSAYTFPTWESIEVDENILKTYEGNYETADFPLDIKIFVDGGKLFAQATGQGAFELTPKSDTEFEFTGAAIKVHFNVPDGFIFNQGGMELDFKRKK